MIGQLHAPEALSPEIRADLNRTGTEHKNDKRGNLTHHHLVLRSKIDGAIPPLPHMPSWHSV
jgi:hypothetical protein